MIEPTTVDDEVTASLRRHWEDGWNHAGGRIVEWRCHYTADFLGAGNRYLVDDARAAKKIGTSA